MGPHELAVDAVLEWQRLGGLRVDHLEQRVLAGGQVQAGGVAALAGHGRPDVAHPERVGDRDAPRALDLGADGGEAGARLARGDDVAEAEGGGVDASFTGLGGEVGGEAQGAEDRGDAEARDQVEQALGLADADRHDGGAGRLDRHVVGDAAGVERVVEAMGDGVGGEEAGDRERLAAELRVGLVVVPGEADRHRLAGGSGGDVQADELLGPRTQVLAERRLPLLARAQLLLGQEGELRQLAPALNALAVEGRARLEVLELCVERGHAATFVRGRLRAATRPATTSAAPATARAVIVSSYSSAPKVSAPNGISSAMNELACADISRNSTVSVTNATAEPTTAR